MSKQSLRIVSWNINGYRAAWKKGIKDWLETDQSDILSVQETKAWQEQLTAEQINPLGYSSAFSQPSRKGYSGVATFSRENPDSVQVGFGKEAFDAEGRVVITRQHGFTLANIYFPNGKQNKQRLEYKMAFYEETLNFFSKLREKGEKIVVVGDYNTAHKPIDLEHPKSNEKTSGFLPIEREWIDRWIEAGFIDIFRNFNDNPKQYSWWDLRTRARERNVGWRIDYFFVSDNLIDSVSDAWIMPEIMGSDHCPIGLELRLDKIV